MSLSPGIRLGSYDGIVSAIGAGGMGEVYRAHDTQAQLRRRYQGPPGSFFALDPDRRARFEREAQTLAALNHPHIAQIYGTIEVPPALVMELVDGEDFSTLSRAAPPLAEALPIARQIAEALEAAHERASSTAT